ncbi:MAG: sigma-70 family RNA polymerase sigma factor [Pseudomonadota bacterium]
MPTDEPDLKELMVAGLDGDAAAHRALLERLSLRLRGYYKGHLTRAGRSATEAEDLVQEALLAIHIHRHTYQRSEPLTPWIYAIARYKLIDHLRHTRTTFADLPIEDAIEIMAHDDHIVAESAYDLDRLLGLLPDKMREPIRCVKIDGLSVAEAANRCGMSQSAIKVNVHRGLKSLAAVITRGKKS